VKVIELLLKNGADVTCEDIVINNDGTLVLHKHNCLVAAILEDHK